MRWVLLVLATGALGYYGWQRFRGEDQATAAGNAQKADDCGSHQTASTAHGKPKQGAKDLSPVQWIYGEHVENQQAQINQCNCPK